MSDKEMTKEDIERFSNWQKPNWKYYVNDNLISFLSWLLGGLPFVIFPFTWVYFKWKFADNRAEMIWLLFLLILILR